MIPGEFSDCEYRACRNKDGDLYECKEPKLRKEMLHIEVENLILSITVFVFFVFTLTYFILE